MHRSSQSLAVNKGAIRSVVACLWLWVICALAPGVASAQSTNELSSAQARTAQYVFVIDDSGSMSRRVRGKAPADPDRLAVFAARSTLSMLDDVDEATVVRLNGPLEGEAVVPVAPLADNRAKLEKMLALDGSVAQYAGDQTPCKSALDAVKKALNDAYRPNVAQVVMFLTDGECTGGQPTVRGFLNGLESADDELFKFYLLRFEGRDYTRALQKLADRTGGMAIEASATDPSAILKPFARALSRSQGYESYLLTPSDRMLDAHRGARRVRLLAVAPDKGKDLDFKINPARKGETPQVLGDAKKGLHQFEDGRRYRYAAIDYRPGTVPVSVNVEGAGRDWKVVAVPEYRLFVEMDVRAGACSQKGEPIHYAEVGSNICAEVRLVNEKGEVVTADVAGRGTEALVRYTAAGGEGEGEGDRKPRELPANRQGDEARFVIERANLEKGDHIFRPMVRLSVPGQQGASVTIKGAAETLQVSSMTIEATPARVDFDTLVPGAEKFKDIKVGGNFPAARARLVVQNREDVPDCVKFALGGKGEGEEQKITPGQSYQLGVDVDPYCGASSFTRDIQTAVRIEFDQSGQLLSVPTLVIPVHFASVSEISVPKALSTTLDAGDSATLDLELDGNFKKDATFNALVPPPDERERWPSNADHLELRFLDGDGEPILNEDDEPAQKHGVSFAPGSKKDPLRIEVASDSCCSGGTYRTEIALVPTSGTKDPIRVPVEITVNEASVWSCWGPAILWALLALLLLLLVLYVYNMFNNSSFLKKKQLINRLKLLEWGPTGMPSASTDGPRQIKEFVNKKFTFANRAKAWFAANPLKLGLPNGYKYDETVRLVLNTDQPRLSSLKVLDKPGHYDRLVEDPRVNGHVYISKNQGFYGVPDLDGYFGSLRHQSYISPPTGELEVVNLSGAKLVLEDDRDRMQGNVAGWEIGY
ncbi:VWA domain-containing protein [Persicimonas caeni]|uniref:VWA domain-containing protein n=1 Tax=Persicimonas caeni TaxID=2292766 RepID=UPI00143D0C72|nr:VWA domain-containing protein [Persicimonas caeni]